MLDDCIHFVCADSFAEEQAIPRKLWAAPRPQFHESAASWVQRVCGVHGYSMTRMREILDAGSEGRERDWDLMLLSPVWSKLSEMAFLEPGAFRRQKRAMRWSRRLFRTYDWMLTSKARPTTAWCPQCLAEDQTPYLRWFWRHRAYERCIVHDQALEHVCATCKTPYWVDRAVLVPSGACMGVPSLAHCGKCGSSLAGPRQFAVKTDGVAPLRRLLIHQFLRQQLRTRLHHIVNTTLNTMDLTDANLKYLIRIRNVATVMQRREVGREKIRSFGARQPFTLLRQGVAALDQHERGAA